MTNELPPRPRQLVHAAGVIIGGSLFLLVEVFDALANLQSVSTREQLQEVIASDAGRDLGVTLDQATSAMRAALSVAGVCGAVAFVLGIFVLQRHRGARIALTVVAVPLLVTAPVVAGFLGGLVAIAALTLWGGPSADWYAGRPIRQPSKPAAKERPRQDAERSATSAPGAPAVPPPTTQETSRQPEATSDFGAPAAPGVSTPLDRPVEASPPGPPGVSTSLDRSTTAAWPPPGVSTPLDRPPAGRPAAVTLACVVAAAFSAIVALLYVAAVFALVVDSGSIVDRVVDSPAWRETGLKDDTLVTVLWFGVLLFLGWSLGAIALAWFTWRRHDWARYLLVVSAVLTFLVGLVAFPFGLLHQIACVVTVVALFAPQARAWFARRGEEGAAGSDLSAGGPPPGAG